MIGLLFAFNMIRGIASCAWFPWIRGLIPETIRGRYLTLESAFANAGSLVAFLLVAIYLGKSPTSGQFTVLFAFSFVMGAVSIAFIRRVPDVAPPEEEAGKKQQAPWAEIFAAKPFRKLLWTELFIVFFQFWRPLGMGGRGQGDVEGWEAWHLGSGCRQLLSQLLRTELLIIFF